jgi:hypothetical protein
MASRGLDMVKLLTEAAEGSGVGHDFHDVVFLMLDEDGNMEGQVKAHKMILSQASEIFQAQFSGPFAEVNKPENGVTQVEIRDTSLAAFQAIILFIYKGTYNWEKGTQENPDVLFQMFGLADKYFLDHLAAFIEWSLDYFSISAKNYAVVFRTVAKYQHLLGFDEVCSRLSKRCVLSVMREWKTVQDSALFWSTDYDDDPSLKQTLMQKMGELAATNCTTCGHPMTVCKAGEKLTLDNCEVGMKVRAERDMTSENGHTIQEGRQGVVKKFSSTNTSTGMVPFLMKKGVLAVQWADSDNLSVHKCMVYMEIDCEKIQLC